MKTEVTMERALFDLPIRQKSKSEYLSARDLEKAGNKNRAIEGRSPWLLDQYLKQKGTLEFIESLEKKIGQKAVVRSEQRGRNGSTWVHPILFIDIALSIDSKLKVEVYSWMQDHLLHYRNLSGDSYQEMSGAVYNLTGRKVEAQNNVIKIAKKIKESLQVVDWETASQNQLEARDRIHKNIKLLSKVMRHLDQVVSLAISEELESRR